MQTSSRYPGKMFDNLKEEAVKTAYVLITLKEYNAMIAALIAYQKQHQDRRDDWRKRNNLPCMCRACLYASEVQTDTAVTPTPIFMPPSLPWPEVDVS